MELAPGVLTWSLLAVAGINLAISVIAVRRKEVRGAVPFAVIMVFVSLYSVGTAVRAASLTLSSYRVGTIIKYAGILGLGPAQLWFGLTYTGRNSLLDSRRWAALLVLPLGVFALVLTAPAHDLLWNVEGFVTAAPAAAVAREGSPVLWLTFIYHFALAVATYILIALVGINRGGKYRTQVILMLIGGITPTIGAVALLSSRNLTAAWDPTAFAFTITGVVFAVALFRYNFLDLIPVARHTLIDEMTDPVFVVGPDGRIVDVNEAGREILGGQETDPIEREAAALLPAYDSLESDSDGYNSVVEVETDGEVQFFDAKKTTLTDRMGTTIGSLFIYRDVTERHSIERRYKRLIERSAHTVSVIDKSGTITYVSQSVEEALGYEPTELVGENLTKRIHPEDREEIISELSKYGEEYGYSSTYKARFRNADGEWRIMEARARNLLDDPFVEGIVLNSHDITEKQQQKRKLERQNQRLDKFASIVSHDLRNPLTVAVGHLELLESEVTDEHDGSIETVQRQLDRMEDIIDDSLTLARSGETVTETSETDLEAIARDAWKNVDTGEATLVVEETLHLQSDSGRLLNVFENLFRNSVEHNESTDLTVEVGSMSGSSGFYIEDTGVGIPADAREQVFEEGYSTNKDGTGFGLAIVRDIVQAHGWELSVTDGAEGGARFEVELAERRELM
ncbi:histidine kinase N-terminal 7TM domain-containing protein [Haloarcula sediminis]|uniref:histidine kinase N-terminal 7TM domain-containing protein n=1 Tax=Haloarcula sediminis TaxID=3111777 RepID=UPI002D7972AE|nr:histidine kinase N-terminal 7TM domain-containing protein [Haloarcula sp. CK38]